MSLESRHPWPEILVADAISPRRGRETRKLKTFQYQAIGTLPIVDQGSKLICGYTDDLRSSYPYDLPVVVFGDHTRALKFVDFPFAIGADGTQCLHPIDGLDPRFFYYALCALDLPSEGYARHFKLLKEKRIPVPALDEQRGIAEVLRAVDEAIASNGAALDQIGRTRSAILYAAFEESAWEPVPLGSLGKWQSGSTPAKGISQNWGGGIPWICPRDMKVPLLSKSTETISEHALGGSCRIAPAGTLMLVVRGMILARAVPTAITTVEAAYNQDIKAFVPNGRASARFVELCIRHQEAELLRLVNTATHGTKKLDSDTIAAIPIPLPDAEAQDALVQTITTLDEAASDYVAEHQRLNAIRQGLLRDLFSGRVRVPA